MFLPLISISLHFTCLNSCIYEAVDAAQLICTALYESYSRIGVVVNFPIQSIHTVFIILISIFSELSSCVLRDKYIYLPI